MKRSRWPVTGCLAVAGALVGTGSLRAQDVGDTPFATEDTIEGLRRLPDLDRVVDSALPRVPLSAEGLQLWPIVEMALVADSNPRVRPDGRSDLALVVEPSVRLKRRSRSTAIEAYGLARVRRLVDLTTENTEEAGLGVDIQHQLNRSVTLRARGEAGHYAEPRSAAFTAENALTPVEYTRLTGLIAASAAIGRLAVTPSVEVDRSIYFDSRVAERPEETLVQRDRTLTRTAARLTVGYAAPGGLTPLIGVEVNDRDYDEARTVDRDSSGLLFFGGVRFSPNPMVEFDLATGYMRQDYTDPLASPSGLYARAVARWTPTPLTRMTLDLRRDVSETGNSALGGALRTRARATIDYRWRRDLLLDARVDARRYDVLGAAVDDIRADTSAGVAWRSAPNLELFARARYFVSWFGVPDGDEPGLPLVATEMVDQAQLLAGVRLIP